MALRGLGRAAGLAPGQHAAWAYRDDAELCDVVVAYLAEGVRRGEEVVLVGTAEPRTLLGLLAGLPGRDELLAAGQLRVGDLRRPGGAFLLADPQEQVAAVAADAEGALARGRTGQRVAVLNTEVGGWSPEQRARLEAYEQAVDALFDRLPLTGLCLYPAQAGRRLGPVMVLHALQHTDGLVPQVQLRCRDGAFALLGELDMAVADEVERALTRAGEQLPADVLRLDLQGLDFMDLHGARTLARAQVRLRAAGKRLALTGARPHAQRCLQMFSLGSAAG